jgi:hypothetical protein
MKHVEIEWYDANILHGWQNDGDCPLAQSKETGWIVRNDFTGHDMGRFTALK